MGISTDRTLRHRLIFFTILLMLAGLFVSRALLSSGMILFLVITCVHTEWKDQLLRFSRNKFLIGLSLLFLIPLVTWFWSEDKEVWWRFVRIKLPLLLMPVAFAGPWQLSQKQWQWIGYAFLIFVTGGCAWSLGQYAFNMQDIHSGYLRAKVIPTPFENDHVRFSLAVCMAILCSALLFSKTSLKKERILLVVIMVFLTVFLHILSARTGLFSLYIILFLGAFYLVATAGKTKWIIAVCLATIAMPVIAWFVAPTFQNRIRYFIYDFSYIQQDTYLPGANDGNRMLSIKAGLDIILNHPFGVGSGDVMKATNDWYDRNIHGMLETDKIYPSSEWMMYGAAAGWIGLILFTLAMALPLFEKTGTGRFFWISLNIITAFSFIFDIGLEVQFGVFLYAFMVLWWWKWLGKTEEKQVS